MCVCKALIFKERLALANFINYALLGNGKGKNEDH